MRRIVRPDKMIRLLAAGFWLAAAWFPAAGETALPARPQTQESALRQRADVSVAAPAAVTPATMAASAGKPETVTPAAAPLAAGKPTGYTEAEIKERMIRKYTVPRPEFRRVSGAAAGADYRPGTADVKIPNLFFPPDVLQDVSEAFLENPDGTFGARVPEGQTDKYSVYSAEAQKQLLEQAARKTGKDGSPANTGNVSRPVQQKNTAPAGAASVRTKYKTITVQVPVPAPSPFRPLAAGDFRWFTNSKGHYAVALPASMPYDPLRELPAFGPMLLRSTSQKEFMAVTADDPTDTYYYKNRDTFPDYGKAIPVFTETRKNIQGDEISIKYIRRYIGGEYCLLVDSTGQRAGKTYRAAVVFPESRQYEYLPKVLYMMETLKGI